MEQKYHNIITNQISRGRSNNDNVNSRDKVHISNHTIHSIFGLLCGQKAIDHYVVMTHHSLRRTRTKGIELTPPHILQN